MVKKAKFSIFVKKYFKDELTILNNILNFVKDSKIKNLEINKNSKELDIYLDYFDKTCQYSKQEPDFQIFSYSKTIKIKFIEKFDYRIFLNFKTPRVKLSTKPIRIMYLKFADEKVNISYVLNLRSNTLCSLR